MASSVAGSGAQELRVGSEFRNGHTVRRFVRGLAEGARLSEEAVGDLLLAVTEAFNNAVEHAHRFEADRPIAIRVHRLPQAIQVDVADDGPGFHLTDTHGAGVLPTQRGLGLYLARQLVDELSVTSGSGTTVHLVKRRGSAEE